MFYERGSLYLKSSVVNEEVVATLCVSVVNFPEQCLTTEAQRHRGSTRGGLRRRLLSLENVTRLHNGRRIDGDVSFVNVLNNTFFIDQESGAVSKPLFLIKNAIVFDHSAFEIAEDWKGNRELLCKFSVGGNTVNTHSENLGVG